MAMPKQVEQEIKNLEELEKRMQAPELTGETAEHDEPTGVIEPEPEEAEPTSQAVESVEPKVDWEQKYRTIVGKYDAEVPRLHAQVRELMEQMQALKTPQVEQLKEQPKTESVVTDKDREDFGDDLIDLQRRIATEVASRYEARLAAAEAKNAALEQSLMQTGSQVGEMTFEQRLYRVVPDFEQINADKRWISWLDETLPDVGVPRREFAQRAYANGDVDGVKRFVDVFKSMNTTAQPKQQQRKTELERQVTPARNSTTNTPMQQQGKTYSYADWQAVAHQVDQLVARGKYAEAEKLEAELADAMQTGRVSA
jgi:hypothetical protein